MAIKDEGLSQNRVALLKHVDLSEPGNGQGRDCWKARESHQEHAHHTDSPGEKGEIKKSGEG